MKSRVMINHLMKYDLINVFWIWISRKMKIIRIRDVFSDLYLFYNLCVSDIKHFLLTKVTNVIQILKIFETTFDDVLIEQNDDDFRELIFETLFKKNRRVNDWFDRFSNRFERQFYFWRKSDDRFRNDIESRIHDEWSNSYRCFVYVKDHWDSYRFESNSTFFDWFDFWCLNKIRIDEFTSKIRVV